MDTQKPEGGSGKSPSNSAGAGEQDQKASSNPEAGQENIVEQEGGKANTIEQNDGQGSTSSRLVERKTGLRNLNIACGRVAQSTIRKRTERDLRLPDAEVPYFKTEKAVRDLVCSLMERQDRMNEAIFLQLNDLEYRVADCEQGRKIKVTKRSATEKDVRK